MISEVKFCFLSHFWSLMLLSSEFMFFWSYFLEWMVESRFRTWFRAKNPIDEELRRKNQVWFNFSSSQNSKLSLCVFMVLFMLEHHDTRHPQESTTETEEDETSPSAPSVFLLFIILLWAVPLCFFLLCVILCTFCYVFFYYVMSSYLLFCYLLSYFVLFCYV